ncbi:MAG TPA: class I adenylate-forming enzyme family protein [Acidimicrobiales bacterium]|nr:class I adenylate-forming enzyme family protein [Acidimicrobiales bacterium]
MATTGGKDGVSCPPTFPPYPPTVPQLLAHGAHSFSTRECVVTPGDRLTYADVERRSRALAGRLVKAGVGKSSRLAVLAPNGAPWVLMWAAAARLGAVVVPVNTFYRPPELANFLLHSDAQFLLGVGSFLRHDYLGALEAIAPGLGGADQPVLFLPELPHLRRVLLWDDDGAGRRWVEGGWGRGLDEPVAETGAAVVAGLERSVTPDDDMLVTYTSGSTGEPKGVVHSHGALIRHACNLAALSGVDATTRIWTPMPLCWVGGFAFSLLRAMVVGGCFLTQPVFEPASALALLERERVTNVSAWPAIARSLVEQPAFATADLSALRSGSFYDALPPDRRPPDPGLVVGSLGMSETCGPHTFWRPGEEVTGAPERYRGAFGHPVPGVHHKVVDPATGAELPDGEEGEVWVRGYSLMKGLYKRERAAVFEPDGWYRTGDRGYFRDGWFFFTGRQSDLIKTKGANVAPAEVERVLSGLEGVKMAMVVGVPDPERGQDVVALVVATDPADPPTGDALRRAAAEHLSSYKVPRRVFVVDAGEVPWLVSQKVDRRAVAALAAKLAGGED